MQLMSTVSKAKLPSALQVIDAPPPYLAAESGQDVAPFGVNIDPVNDGPLQIRIEQTNPSTNPVEGVQPGDWVIGNVTHAHELSVLFCGLIHTKTEFGANRGGFVARHLTLPANAVTLPVKDGERRPRVVCPDVGTEIRDTSEVYLLLLPHLTPAVYYAASTAINPMRMWQLIMKNTHVHPGTGRLLPEYAKTYALATQLKNGAKGSWYLPQYTDRGWTQDENASRAAQKYAAQVKAGEVRVAGMAL
jgi:hypothetical protein